MKRLLVAALAAFLLCACSHRSSDPELDYGKCLSGHDETTFIPMMSGKVMTYMPITDYVCDHHQYPYGHGPGYAADLKRWRKAMDEWRIKYPKEVAE